MAKRNYKPEDKNCIAMFSAPMKGLHMKVLADMNNTCPFHIKYKEDKTKVVVFSFENESHILLVHLAEEQIKRAYKAVIENADI